MGILTGDPAPIGPVVLFGELLLRLDTPGHQRFAQASHLDATFTGGEANVGVALSQWGIRSRLASTVPAHDIGDACLNHFRRYGVETSHVLRGGERLGILFVENGASQRGSKVIYDRQHTSFRNLAPDELNWAEILADASWLHVTGTVPAFGPHLREILADALRVARGMSVPISFDCSYRSALWSENEAAEVFPGIVRECDLLIGSEDDAHRFLGVRSTGDACLRETLEKYDLHWVAFTTREVLPTGVNRYAAAVYNGDGVHRSPMHEMTVVDRIGAGDAFAAGLIRGLLLNEPMQETVNFATAAAVLKHSIPGDFLLCRAEEVEQLAGGERVGRVQR